MFRHNVHVFVFIGLLRDNSCSYNSAHQAYTCTAKDYEMLIIESMDSDTETRRVSPVGILNRRHGYVDLLNGPQDHGWCLGYTCQKRLSTFPVILAMGETYDIVFTGTTPQSIRLHLLNTDVHQAVLVSIWYAVPNRLDVYTNDGNVYVPPENYGLDLISNEAVLRPPSKDDPYEYYPSVERSSAGDNYFDRESQTLYVLVRGNEPVLIKTSPLIVVTFNVPALSVDDFYGDRLVENLAAFLDLPPERIRIVDIIRARRKRATDDSTEVMSKYITKTQYS